MSTQNEQDPRKAAWLKRRHFALRLNVFFFCSFILFSVLVVRLAILQFVDYNELVALKNDTKEQTLPISPIRGNIYDREGAALAYSTSTQSLYYRVEPNASADHFIDLAKTLESIFNEYGNSEDEQMTAEEILERMDTGYNMDKERVPILNRYSDPRRIKTNLSDHELAYFAENRDQITGIEIVEESIRHYTEHPNGETTIAAQLIGYLRSYGTAIDQKASMFDVYRDPPEDVSYLTEEYVGFDGLEYMYQDELRGENGEKVYSVNPLGQIVGDRVSITPPVKGHNLYLTLDKDVQIAAETAIVEHLEKLNTDPTLRYINKTGTEANSGYAVAIEVSEESLGKVVAMASIPSYDSNVWWGGLPTETYYEIQNKYPNGAITGVLNDKDPAKHLGSMVFLGSSIKPLTVLVGLDQGLITTESRYTDTGIFRFGNDNSSIRNAGGAAYGSMDAAYAIEKSSNTFMAAMIGEPLYRKYGGEDGTAIEVWDSYMKKFGLGADTGSGLPNESRGVLDYTNTEQTGSVMASLVFASFGQGAKYTTLQLAQYVATLATEGKRPRPQFVDKITTYDGQIVSQFEPEILNEVEFKQEYWDEIKEGMLKVYKTGFEGFPYSVASKTGTSEQQVAGKTVENAVFIAYAPADNPKLAVAVVVPEGGYGSQGAAPIARKIFDAYFQEFGMDE